MHQGLISMYGHGDEVTDERAVGFLLPIVCEPDGTGKIYLAARGTEPFKGYYGAVGGKADAEGGPTLFGKEQLVIKPNWQGYPSLADTFAREEGRELPNETCVREFCEEIFSKLKYPDDFASGDITDVFRMGFIDDVLPVDPTTVNHCYFALAKVHRHDFSLSPREVSDFRPLVELGADAPIFPLTKIALAHLKYVCENEWMHAIEGYAPYVGMGLEKQIPDFDDLAYRHTNLSGAIERFFELSLIW